MRIPFATPVADLSGGARVIHIYAKALKESCARAAESFVDRRPRQTRSG
jgi:hypothetical protein